MSNTVLATILEKAKDLDVPKDIVERNIKRASEKGQEDFIEKIYEVYISHKLQTLVLCFQVLSFDESEINSPFRYMVMVELVW